MRLLALFIVISFVGISIQPAVAHLGAFTYEATVNNYFVDIGASKLQFVPHELVLFEFNLYPSTDPNNLADFDNVYVTMGDETAVQLSTFVHRPQEMLTVLSYSFPKSGRYEMSARFQKGGQNLAEVTFPIEVGEGAGTDPNFIIRLVLSIIITAVVVLVIVKWIKRSKQLTQ